MPLAISQHRPEGGPSSSSSSWSCLPVSPGGQRKGRESPEGESCPASEWNHRLGQTWGSRAPPPSSVAPEKAELLWAPPGWVIPRITLAQLDLPGTCAGGGSSIK